MNPMRLFLSYGHDAHTVLAQRRKSDLERRNHQVWLDQARLTPGTDWERNIEEGLDWVLRRPRQIPHAVDPALSPRSAPMTAASSPARREYSPAQPLTIQGHSPQRHTHA
jgi:hypothetical protein